MTISALALLPALLFVLHSWTWLTFGAAVMVVVLVALGAVLFRRRSAISVLPLATLYVLVLFAATALVVPLHSTAWLGVDLESCSTIRIAAAYTESANGATGLDALLNTEALLVQGAAASVVLGIELYGATEFQQLESAARHSGASLCRILTTDDVSNRLAVSFHPAGEASGERIWPDAFPVTVSNLADSSSEPSGSDGSPPPGRIEIRDWALVVPLARSPLRLATQAGNEADAICIWTAAADDVQGQVALPEGGDLRTWEVEFFTSDRTDTPLEFTLDTSECIVLGGDVRMVGASGAMLGENGPFYARLTGVSHTGLKLTIPSHEFFVFADAELDERLNVASASVNSPRGDHSVVCSLFDAAGALNLSGEHYQLDGTSPLAFATSERVELVSAGAPDGIRIRRMVSSQVYANNALLTEGVLWDRLSGSMRGLVVSLLTGMAMFLLGMWASSRSKGRESAADDTSSGVDSG